jgi:hypothetical protein
VTFHMRRQVYNILFAMSMCNVLVAQTARTSTAASLAGLGTSASQVSIEMVLSCPAGLRFRRALRLVQCTGCVHWSTSSVRQGRVPATRATAAQTQHRSRGRCRLSLVQSACSPACMHALPLVAASIRPGAGRRGALRGLKPQTKQARAHEWRHSGAGRCVALAGRQLCPLLQRVTRANAPKAHQALRSSERCRTTLHSAWLPCWQIVVCCGSCCPILPAVQ